MTALDIEIDSDLVLLLNKLRHCQDPKTNDQVFIGAIKVEVRGNVILLCVEETTWDTLSGVPIDTTLIRSH